MWPIISYGDVDLSQHWLRWWLVAEGYQVITWSNVNLTAKVFCGIHMRAISQEVVMNLICNMCSEVTHFILPLHLSNKHHGHWQSHDDVIKWKHFPRHWPFVRGIHWSPVNSPHKGQWRGALMCSLICAWINGWVNNPDWRCHHAHYDVIVMTILIQNCPQDITLGHYSLSGWMSYCKIAWSVQAMRLCVIMIQSPWNLTGISVSLLPRCLLNFKAIGKV